MKQPMMLGLAMAAAVCGTDLRADDAGWTKGPDFSFDTREEKTISGQVAETLTYSGDDWGAGGSGVTVWCSRDGGEAEMLETPAGSGTVSWKPTLNGLYLLIHAVDGGETNEAVFVVNGFPGGEGNPWEIGEGVSAYIKNGVLCVQGTGEMDDFASAEDVPWAAFVDDVTAVTIAQDVTKVGKNSLAGFDDKVTANGTPLSFYDMMAGARGSDEPAEPSGAVSGAEPETVRIVDGKVLLGVSVCTNGDVTAATEDWQKAAIEKAQVEEDGTVTLTIPATAEKGFMLLKSKGAAPSNIVIEDR